jgi:hypothetical protein
MEANAPALEMPWTWVGPTKSASGITRGATVGHVPSVWPLGDLADTLPSGRGTWWAKQSIRDDGRDITGVERR